MFELNVPFLEKEAVKALGGRWNNITKKWFVPTGMDAEAFKKWWPADFLVAKTASEQPSSNNITTLAAFLKRVQNVINQNFVQSEWIIAEISEISLHSGHYYINLVEYNETGQKQAQINARIWRENAVNVMQKFKAATDSEIVSGIKVLLLASVAYNPQYGLSLTIEDIDPAYTLGDMAAKIKNIKTALQQEQILDQNKKIIAPTEFTRIAVISPENAAGLGDFAKEADILEKYNLCTIQYYTATFQGKTAANEINSAIKQVLAANAINPFDALVIIRGGGSVADLAWLNDLELARAICLCPLYVMVGVGHKRDYTVLDDIAAASFDTPSKVIAYIFQVIVRNAEIAFANFTQCIKQVQQTIVIVKTELAQTIANIKQDVTYTLEYYRQQITILWRQLTEDAGQNCLTVEQKLEALMREILCQGPAAVLTKGFALAKSLTDEIISSAAKAASNKTFYLNFHDGTLLVKDSCSAAENNSKSLD